MKKNLFVVFTLLCSFLLIEVVNAEVVSYEPVMCDYDSTTGYLQIRFMSGFQSQSEAKSAGLTTSEINMIYDGNSNKKIHKFDRGITKKIVSGITYNNSHEYYSKYPNLDENTRNAYNLRGLSDITVDGVSYTFGGWYYDPEFKNKVTAENALDLDLNAVGNAVNTAQKYGCPKTGTSSSIVYTSTSYLLLYAKWIQTNNATKPVCQSKLLQEKIESGASLTDDEKKELKNRKDYVTGSSVSINGTTYDNLVYLFVVGDSSPTDNYKSNEISVYDAFFATNATTLPTNNVSVKGYSFGGYYYDNLYTQPVPSLKVNEIVKWVPNRVDVHGCPDSWSSIYLYPKWYYVEDEQDHSVVEIEFYSNFGTNLGSSTAMSNSNSYLPSLMLDGYVFEGWYYDGKFQNKIQGERVKDIDLSKIVPIYNYNGVNGIKYRVYAKWSKLTQIDTAFGSVRLSGFNNSLGDLNSAVIERADVSSVLSTRNVAYDITLKKEKRTMNGTKEEIQLVDYQPNGQVRVGLLVPAGYDVNKLKIYYYNGSRLTEMPIASVGNDGYAYFYTDHFSTYVIADGESSGGNDPVTDKIVDLQNITAKTSTGSSLALSPSFSSSYTGEYSIGNVDSSVDKILFTITKSDTSQVVTVNGINSNECNLSYGDNKCIITSANGSSTRSYVVNVYRNIYVEPLDLEAKISKIVYNGNDYLPDSNSRFVINGIAPSKSSINILAYAAEGSTINGNKVGSLGYISTSIELPLSFTQINNELMVLSPGGNNDKTYTLVVNRRSVGTDATLSKLEVYLSNGNLNLISSKFSPSTLNYNVNVAADSTQLVLDYETNDSNARVNNSNKGTINCSISKTSPSCTIKVIAEDGNSSKSYTVNAIYPEATANTDSSLKSLTILEPSGIQFTFSSSKDTQSLITVPYEISYIKFNPVLNVSDPTKAWIVEKDSNYNSCVLNVGDNTCRIVTNSDGGVSHNYEIPVTRAPQAQPVDESDTLPVNICLDNNCSTIRSQVAYVTDYSNKSDGHPTYVASVNSDVSSVIFKLNGNVSNTDFASDAVTTCNLAVGENTCPVKITKAGNVRTYVIKITRANSVVELSDDARLSSFEINPSSLSLVETFNMDKEGIYHILAEHSVEAIGFTNLKTYLDDASVLEAESNLNCPLVDGSNECVITVLAPNGTTKKRYYFVVERSTSEAKPSPYDIPPFDLCTKANCDDGSLIIYKKITGPDGTIIYQAEVEYEVTEVIFKINDSNSNLTISKGEVCKLNTVGVNECEVTVSGDAYERLYKFEITRKPAPENPSPSSDVDPCEADPNSKECKKQICTNDPSKCEKGEQSDTGAFAFGTIVGLATLIGAVFILKSRFGSKIYKI